MVKIAKGSKAIRRGKSVKCPNGTNLKFAPLQYTNSSTFSPSFFGHRHACFLQIWLYFQPAAYHDVPSRLQVTNTTPPVQTPPVVRAERSVASVTGLDPSAIDARPRVSIVRATPQGSSSPSSPHQMAARMVPSTRPRARLCLRSQAPVTSSPATRSAPRPALMKRAH